jgi:hypothetical protein
VGTTEGWAKGTAFCRPKGAPKGTAFSRPKGAPKGTTFCRTKGAPKGTAFSRPKGAPKGTAFSRPKGISEYRVKRGKEYFHIFSMLLLKKTLSFIYHQFFIFLYIFSR